jgi:hypothetical protein
VAWATAAGGAGLSGRRSIRGPVSAGCDLLGRAVDNWAKTSGDVSRGQFLTALVDLSAAQADDGRLAQAMGTFGRAVDLAEDLGPAIRATVGFEVRLRNAGMWLVLNEPVPTGHGVAISDAVRADVPLADFGEQPDPDMGHVVDVLRLYDTGNVSTGETRERIIGFPRYPARHRANSFKVFLYSELGELSARARGASKWRELDPAFHCDRPSYAAPYIWIMTGSGDAKTT